MASDLSSYKVGSGEVASSSKFDNLVQAVQDALNAVGDQTKMAWAAGKIIDPVQIQQKGATSGQALVWNGTDWAPATVGGGGGGTSNVRLAHQTKTTDTTINATSEGTANSIIVTPSFTADANPVLVSFFAPRVDVLTGVAGNNFIFNFVLLRDSTVIVGKWGVAIFQIQGSPTPPSDDQTFPIFLQHQDTPGAGAHTYTVKAYLTFNTGTGSTMVVKAGAGGTGVLAPAFLRVFKDST